MVDLVEALRKEKDARVRERILALRLFMMAPPSVKQLKQLVGLRERYSIGLRGLGRVV
jgi:hypothetical protein